MICNCGASCRTSDTADGMGTIYTCPACGRREVIDWSSRRKPPDPPATPTVYTEFNLSMDQVAMPKKRRKR